jgi:cullin 3
MESSGLVHMIKN